MLHAPTFRSTHGKIKKKAAGDDSIKTLTVLAVDELLLNGNLENARLLFQVGFWLLWYSVVDVFLSVSGFLGGRGLEHLFGLASLGRGEQSGLVIPHDGFILGEASVSVISSRCSVCEQWQGPRLTFTRRRAMRT